MTTAPLIVCEKRGRWAAALRRELVRCDLARWGDRPRRVPIREIRRLEECHGLMQRWPAGAVAIEVSRENLADALESTARLDAAFPRALVVALVRPEVRAAQWVVREAGATAVALTPRRLDPLARMIVRHLALTPPPTENRIEQIWADLPWGSDHAK